MAIDDKPRSQPTSYSMTKAESFSWDWEQDKDAYSYSTEPWESGHSNQGRKRNQHGSEKSKIVYLNMTFYMANPKASIRKLLDLINEFSTFRIQN